MTNRSPPPKSNQAPLVSQRMDKPDFVDPWNWKMPSRSDLMSLNTLSEKNDLVRVKTAIGLRTKRTTTTNMMADDIKGAAPKVEIKREVTRELFYDNKDISGAKTRALHVQLKKDYNALANADIHGSKPQVYKFQTTRKQTNPLCPDYVLPHYEITYPEPPKFIRDGMAVEDIEGSRAKKHTDKFLGDRMNTRDIVGTSPKKRLERKEHHDQEFKDVYAKKELKRDNPFNPQEPTYKIRDENNNVIDIGEVKGSKATEPYYRKNQEDIKVNTVKGIDRATAGSNLLGNFHTFERREYRKTNDISDISGTQAKTLIKGIKLPVNVKRRQTNPLNPMYQILGGREDKLNIEIDPYGRDGCSMTKDLYVNAVQRPQTASNFQSGNIKSELQKALDDHNVYKGKIPTINTNLPRFDNDGKNTQSARSIKSAIQPPTQVPKPPQTPTPQSKGSKRSELQRRNTTQVLENTKGSGSNRIPPASAKLSSKKSPLMDDPYGGLAKENDSQGFNKSQRSMPSAGASSKRINKPLSNAQKMDKFISQPPN